MTVAVKADKFKKNFPPLLEKSTLLEGRKARYYTLDNSLSINSAVSDNQKPYGSADFEDLQSNKKNRPTAHFYGGNGFVASVYQPLMVELGQSFNVVSLAMRGYWFDAPKQKVLTRQQDADALIKFLEQTQDKPVIGIGHSQGATATAMAAAQRPDLFSALYLIDPVTFTCTQVKLYQRVPRFIMMTQEPFKSTAVKQSDWATIDDYYNYLRQSRAYRRISDDNLAIFAKNSLVPKLVSRTNEDVGYQLLFDPKYELASYFGIPYITDALIALNEHQLPYTLLLAKPSVFNSGKIRQSWQNIVPKKQTITLPAYGHLLPLEAPKTCAEIIINRFQTLASSDE